MRWKAGSTGTFRTTCTEKRRLSGGRRCCTARHRPGIHLNPGFPFGIATDRGRPSSNIRFRTLQAIAAWVTCVAASRDRNRPPTIDFHLKNGFSTRPW